MAKWTSGRSERTFNQSAANSRNEPIVSNAAWQTEGCFARKTAIRFSWGGYCFASLLCLPTSAKCGFDFDDIALIKCDIAGEMMNLNCPIGPVYAKLVFAAN
jgi:hypothetical protein